MKNHKFFSLYFASLQGNSRSIFSSPIMGSRLSFMYTGVPEARATSTIFSTHSRFGWCFLLPGPVIAQRVPASQREVVMPSGMVKPWAGPGLAALIPAVVAGFFR